MIINIKGITTKFLLCGSLLTINLMTSCDSFLDVRPVGELPSDQLLNSASGYESAIYGVYASLNDVSLYGGNLSHETIEVLAQYFVSTGGGNDYVTSLKNYDYTNSAVEETINTVWGKMYTNIAAVNNILINLEKAKPESLRYYNLYKGEALGLRAFMHFDLLRLFTEHIEQNPNASGIPYSTKFELSPSKFSAASKVYEQIISDLLEAEKLLELDKGYFTYPKLNPGEPFLRDREIHFNLYAVQATLARVYFTKGDKVNAAVYAKKVIDSKKFELMTVGEVGQGVTRGVLYPKETIFGIYSQAYFNTVLARFYQQTSFFSFNLRSDIRNIYQAELQGNDYRWEGFFTQPTTSTAAMRFTKLVDNYTLNDLVFLRPAGLIDGINLIRLPEMYYILSESLIDTDEVAANNYLASVLKSRGLTSLSDRNPVLPITVERIANDRYKEFIGEGQTFFNMKRLNSNIKNTDGVEVTASSKIYVWPIPNDEKEFNN